MTTNTNTTLIANTVRVDEIDGLDADDVGRVVLYHPHGNALAVEPTLEECVATAERCTGERIDLAAICTDDDWDGSSLCAARVVA